MAAESSGTSPVDALDMAVGTAVAAALADDGVAKPVDIAALPPNCLNCGAAVRGRFCVDCGQTTDTHVPTLGEVVGDALTSLLNLDSRMWRTFGMLFFAPGRLTQEFLAGRRARYVPPLRLYLVLSVFTFLVLSVVPDDDAVPERGAEGSSVSEQERNAAIEREVDARVAAALQNIPQLAAEDGEPNPDPDLDFSRGVDFARNDAGNLTITDANGNSVEVEEEDCDEMSIPGVDRDSFVVTALRRACLEGRADDFQSIRAAFVDNVPLLTFMVIPVMAVVFKLFYFFTRRNYVAHLVFLCHTHAFTFLLVVVLTLMRFVGHKVSALSTPFSWLGGALLLLYMPAYYFLAMRRVYEQGVALTLFKQFVLMLVYFVAALLVFTVGFVVVILVT